jgi:hypothetical protein
MNPSRSFSGTESFTGIVLCPESFGFIPGNASENIESHLAEYKMDASRHQIKLEKVRGAK